jgi:plastocyanin
MSLTRAGVSVLLVCAVGGATACKSSSSPSPTPTPTPGGTVVSIRSGASVLTTTAYNPSAADIAVGTAITWTNNDSTPHTTTADNNTWNSGAIAAGGQFTFTFQTAGTFVYHCTIHPGMVGSVVVH